LEAATLALEVLDDSPAPEPDVPWLWVLEHALISRNRIADAAPTSTPERVLAVRLNLENILLAFLLGTRCPSLLDRLCC
jgi:hypothetical protein